MFLNIKHKLLLTFITLALITGIIGTIGRNSILSIAYNFSQTTDNIIPAIKLLHDIRINGLVLADSASISSTDEVSTATSMARKKQDEFKKGLYTFIALESRHNHSPKADVSSVQNAAELLLEDCGYNYESKTSLKKDLCITARASFLKVLDAEIIKERSILSEIHGNVDKSISSANKSILYGSIVAFLIALAAGFSLTASIIRPVNRLKKSAEILQKGNYSHRIKNFSLDELGELSNTFNKMSESLEKAIHENIESRSYLENILEASGEAITVSDLEGRIVKINFAASSLLGISDIESYPRNIRDFFLISDDFNEIRDSLSSSSRIVKREVVFKITSRVTIPAEITASLLEYSGGSAGIVWIADDISERKRTEEEIRNLAFFDTLTSLPNRALFNDRFNQALHTSKRNKSFIAIMLLDLDQFKQINDTMGHQCGDQLLKAVAERLKSGTRRSDTFARLGGDEFVLMMPDPPGSESIALLAQKIVDAFNEPFLIEERSIPISSSIGIAIFPTDGNDAETLLSHADMAMYSAKERGRNRYCFYSSEMNEQLLRKQEIASRLKVAIDENRLYLDYQPQYELATDRLVSVEALVRWLDPEKGRIPPDEFISVAEESGLIHQLGEWVLTEACRQGEAWREMGLPPIRIAVNISSRQFKQENLIDTIDKILLKTGVDPGRLELELTESILMENTQNAISILVDFKVRGIHLAIDDFGTGYSSLSYLKFLPLDRLKIDKTFVRDIIYDSDDASIVTAIIGLSHSLGLKVIAEGVETAEQMAFLREHGCDEVQGYYMSKPVSPDKIEAILKGS